MIATYVFALVVFTSWPRKRGSRRVWLAIHLMSVPAAVLAGVHAWMVGSSRGQLWFAVLLVALVGVAVHPAVLRLLAGIAKRSARPSSRRAPGHPPLRADVVATDPPPAAPPTRPPTAGATRHELVGSGPRSR